ncbi:MAG: DUF4279 domain-containing protein [Verrucomicrobiaceae bacterium]|nr:MAG: DUF4279 domain-containing protein [Verrucomicrobiaceae bacterium]
METTDESDTTFWCRASLRIMDAPQCHEEVNSVLGSPSHCHVAGELASEESGRRWKNSIWIRESSVPEERELHEHLAWIVDFASPHEAFLRRLADEGARIDVYMSYACSDDHRGFGFDPEQLEFLVRLGIRMEVSIMT